MRYLSLRMNSFRAATCGAATPWTFSAFATSLAALRFASPIQADQWLLDRQRSPQSTRPLVAGVEEPCDETQAKAASAEAEQRSAKVDAANTIAYLSRISVIARGLNLFEPTFRTVCPPRWSFFKTIRVLFAKWLRGRMAMNQVLTCSGAWRRRLSKEETRHLEATYKSLMRKGTGKTNPRCVRAFEESINDFARWSLQSGFSLESELELINPRIIECVVARPRSALIWNPDGTAHFEFYSRWFVDDEAPASAWITDYDIRWTSHATLRSRQNVCLTPYGHRRFKNMSRDRRRRKRARVRYKGKRWSLSALASLPEAAVSDKIIRKRLEAGWSVVEAITRPASLGGRPRNQVDLDWGVTEPGAAQQAEGLEVCSAKCEDDSQGAL